MSEDIINRVRQTFIDSISVKQEILDNESYEVLIDAGNIIANSISNGGKLLLCGNGGSAADAQHLAAEFVSKLARDRDPLPALALTVDSSMITAIGNDYGYENIFVRQISANGASGDVLLAISTSGSSLNVVKAAAQAKEMGIKVIGLTGQKSGSLDDHCDVVLKAPSEITAVIQECHILIEHSLCEHVENEIFFRE